jgi:hypothetical protein
LKIAYNVIGVVTVGLAIASVAQLFVFHHINVQLVFVHVYSERFSVSPLTTSTLHDVAEAHPLVV